LSKFEHFQFLLILFLNQITIFGGEFQIIQVKLKFKYSQKSLIFSSKKSNSEFSIFNFQLFWKLNFFDIIWDFLTVWLNDHFFFFSSTGVTILFKKPTAKDPNLFSFLSPLSLGVWIYIVTAYLAVSLLLYVLAR